MKIKEIFNKKNPVLSFEVFPPKKDSGFESVKMAVHELCAMKVDYMSVTYGAGGSTSKKTGEIAAMVENQGVPALAHLTCISSTKEQIKTQIDDLKEKGIENILALRGDYPKDEQFISPMEYKYASELIKDIKGMGEFCVGGACYPECHPDCENLNLDIEHLKIKQECGADFLVTQMFFDNDAFYNFRNKAVQKGITIPITAGIMPLTNAGQIQRMCVLSGGASMPAKFTRMIGKYQDNPAALKQAGIAYAVDQIIDLLSNDVMGIHLYTMNKPEVAEKILGVVNYLF